jgi:DNA modification methylase
MTGRTYIGVDLSEEYCAIAQDRIDLTDEIKIEKIES